MVGVRDRMEMGGREGAQDKVGKQDIATHAHNSQNVSEM